MKAKGPVTDGVDKLGALLVWENSNHSSLNRFGTISDATFAGSDVLPQPSSSESNKRNTTLDNAISWLMSS